MAIRKGLGIKGLGKKGLGTKGLIEEEEEEKREPPKAEIKPTEKIGIPEIPKAPEVPLPQAFATETRDVLRVIQGSGGEIFLERLKPSQLAAAGLQIPKGGLTPEQQAAEQKQILQPQQEKARELFLKYQGQPLPQEELNKLSPSDIDAYQAIAAGTTSGLMGGGGAGLLRGALGIGARAGIGLGAAAGIGAGLGVLQGVKSNIASQIEGNIAASTIQIRRGEQNLRMIITDINSGGNMITNTNLFFENLAALQKSHTQLKLDTQRNLADFTGKKGIPELARYEIFFEQTLPLLERELAQAIVNPNPNKILVDASDFEAEE